MKTILIREHETGAVEMISGVPDDVPAGEVVERWQRASIQYQVRGTLPGVTWKVAESTDMVACLIESKRI